MREENREYPSGVLVEIPPSKWPPKRTPDTPWPFRVLRSRDFLVQIFSESPGHRISVNRTIIDGSGNWLEGITFDELFWIKNACGFKDYDAVELYSSEKDLVNVSNMRHLWVLKEPAPFGWRCKK